MNRASSLLTVVAILVGLAIPGCLRLGPDYERPDTGLNLPDKYLSAVVDGIRPKETSRDSDDNWWEEFEDPRLNQVIANVITGNPDIRKAAASVLEAHALKVQARAARFPALGLDAQAGRQKQPMINPLTEDNIVIKSDSFSLAFPASFEVDLWGRLLRASQAARADLLAAEENSRTIAQSLIAEAVSRYFSMQSLTEQLQITRQLTKTIQESLDLVENRYRLGLASILDVHQARQALAQYQAEIPSLVEALGRARQSLAVLQGVYPSVEEINPVRPGRFVLPPPVPAGLPSDLLQRRPDIRAAEAALEAACARIGVARANRFPRISLTGSFGYASDELDFLFKPESELWQIGAGIFQPLFDAGKLKAIEKAARARYQQQLADYAKTLLTAFAEVEGALLTREQQIERLDRLQIFYNEANATQETALDRYQRGLIDYMNVLDAQQAVFQAEISLTKTRYQIYTNRISLYRALGGNWEQEATGERPHVNG